MHNAKLRMEKRSCIFNLGILLLTFFYKATFLKSRQYCSQVCFPITADLWESGLGSGFFLISRPIRYIFFKTLPITINQNLYNNINKQMFPSDTYLCNPSTDPSRRLTPRDGQYLLSLPAIDPCTDSTSTMRLTDHASAESSSITSISAA